MSIHWAEEFERRTVDDLLEQLQEDLRNLWDQNGDPNMLGLSVVAGQLGKKLTAERDGLRTCKECGLLEPERLCRQCHNAACESEADGLRAALERAHACATLLDDGTCAGCFVSAALGRPEKENP
jgi:hypothetical protein